MPVLSILLYSVSVRLASIYLKTTPLITKAAVAQWLEHHPALPALKTGLPIGHRGSGMSRTGHEGEDSGFESLQLRFSFCYPCLVLVVVSAQDYSLFSSNKTIVVCFLYCM